jgi:hypothetical protein
MDHRAGVAACSRFSFVFRNLTIICAIWAGLIAAAHADVFVKEVSLGAGQYSGQLVLPVGTANYWAGYQNISVADDANGRNARSFIAYCADPFHYSTTSYNDFFNAPVTTALPGRAADIQKLFDGYYGATIGSNSDAAAFQLALWEIANDDKNLGTGVVKTTTSTDGTLFTKAGTILRDFSSYNGPQFYSLTLYQVNRTIPNFAGQDYIVATPVPEPGTWAMLLAGLVGLGGMVRRRVA